MQALCSAGRAAPAPASLLTLIIWSSRRNFNLRYAGGMDRIQWLLIVFVALLIILGILGLFTKWLPL